MGNCISKISKDHLLTFEKEIKNFALFFKGNTRLGLDVVTGGTFMKLYSIKKYSKALAPLQTGSWWRDLFQKTLVDIKRYSTLS